MDFSELSRKPEFNTLASELVRDNCCGHATMLANKTSIWVVCGEKVLRICNIATTNVNGVDDVGIFMEEYQVKGVLYSHDLPRALCEVNPKRTVLYMNPYILEMLSHAVLIQVVSDKYYYMGAECRPDSSIRNDEETVQ